MSELDHNYNKSNRVGTLNILFLGLVSLFIDMSTEMVYPIVPLFLLALGTQPAIIGIIEGVSESVAAFLKVGSGYIGDKTNKKKPLAIAGYSSAFFYKIIMFLSSGWLGVLFAKIIDKTGKGIRVAPRDSLIAESGNKKRLGKTYGVHKTFDMLGSAIGVLLAFVVLYFDYNYKTVFLVSMVPAVLGVILLLFVKENRSAVKTARQKLSLKNIKLSKKLWLYLITVFVFSIGNSSNSFLLLKAKSNGFDDTTVLLVYFVYNIAASILAVPSGKLSDKIGRRPLIVGAYLVYGMVYLGLTLFTQSYMMFILFGIYGLYTAMLSGNEKALAVELSPTELKGTVLGLQGMAQGVGLLVSSIIAGVLWQCVGDNFPFWFGSAAAFVAAFMMLFVLRFDKRDKRAAE